MRLNKIKLAGFKSFVDPTSIPFPDDMTAVVGPNGCGKSNVIDAVRWVLGESSAKNLRGDAMTDVIFNGSSARKPVSQCSVELVFDNSSGRIQGEYAKFNELSVKRLVTRDGQSSYFLNASKCRKRDVTDLFLGTGLGPRSYAIIEQGMISRLIESKPQELRVFIEEAAGVSKYKERRRETENRIRHTRENLERLDDVRSELGQHLEKLQRQAAAAKRYKELKAKERRLKGELAAIRWLKHSEQVDRIQVAMSQQESDLEAFIAQQRGDERGITEFREKQSDLKQKLSDTQQQHFSLSNDITRIEQNQIHAKQRRQKIEFELAELQQKHDDLRQLAEQHDRHIGTLQQQLAVSEPEHEMLNQQLQQRESNLLEQENVLEQHQRQTREQDNHYNQLKQQLQIRHSKIQSTMDLQMRTQQRISELQQEQRELQDDESQHQIDAQQQALEDAELGWQRCNQRHTEKYQQLQAQQQHLAQLNSQLNDVHGELQQTRASLAALTSLQQVDDDQTLNEWLERNHIQSQRPWQYFRCQKRWENALESVISQWSKSRIIAVDSSQLHDFDSQLLLEEAFTSNKVKGTLAEVINQPRVPHWSNQIHLVDDDQQACQRQSTLSDGQSLLSPSGLWVGRDWQQRVTNSQQGMLARTRQIESLTVEADGQQCELDKLQQQQSDAEQQVTVLQKQLEEAVAERSQAEQVRQQRQNQLQVLRMQQQQQISRSEKTQQELARQLSIQEEDKLQSEQLAMEVEELEMQLDERGQQQAENTAKHEDLQQGLQLCKSQMEQGRQQLHQFDLQQQTRRHELSSAEQLQQRNQLQLSDIQTRLQRLKEEQQELGMPLEEQAEQLEVLFEQRNEVEQRRTLTAESLSEVELLLADAEKGQQGVQDRIQQMRTQLESSKLEYEGYRVRAGGIMEQLQESNQSLKSLLESLPEGAEEKPWQQDLEKTTASIQRLGAVNLAAVEEYEIQAERKAHLDEQNADLTAALETLESAIRKIDKETRTRFKDTFDRVNEDLKALFPKVFGGGSAYLELTDDDLLETGVAIMARPPGKKNSTIHLLSGGEKALTALSLVFAIFRLNPAPFCLLDEVDAPLDDANVGRFCKLVSEMSKTVQFIYITHNKIAMEMASHLTGVTMSEPGVSRMVVVDVEEAIAIAHA